MKFQKFFELYESIGSMPDGYTLEYWSDEEDSDDGRFHDKDLYDVADEADRLAKRLNMHITRNLNLRIVVFNPSGDVVGALYEDIGVRNREEFRGNDAGESMDGPNGNILRTYDFTLVVDPNEQGKKIGYTIAQEVLKRARDEECDLCYVWVINPKMARILEYLGFEYWHEPDEIEGKYSSHMIKWM
jgi:GNAT superfamily N-acetyltransferase